MSDGITDTINACKEEERWEKVIHPYVKNKLLGKKPEELTPMENHWVWFHYREQENKIIEDIRRKYRKIKEPWWDAYVGQGEYRHTKKGLVKKK